MKFQLNYSLLRTVLNNRLECAIACFVMLRICSCLSTRKKGGGCWAERTSEPQNIFYKSNSRYVKVQLHLFLALQILQTCPCQVWNLTCSLEGAFV